MRNGRRSSGRDGAKRERRGQYSGGGLELRAGVCGDWMRASDEGRGGAAAEEEKAEEAKRAPRALPCLGPVLARPATSHASSMPTHVIRSLAPLCLLRLPHHACLLSFFARPPPTRISSRLAQPALALTSRP